MSILTGKSGALDNYPVPQDDEPTTITPPLAMVGFHNLAGLPFLVRLDHVIGVNAITATTDIPSGPNDPPGHVNKKTMPCTQLLLVNCNSPSPVVAERIDQACEILNNGMKNLQRQVQQQNIVLPRGGI